MVEQAVVGAGCFWCVEAVFERIPGVTKVEAGYSGGQSENPTYQEVCSGLSGHAEVARISFDPNQVSFSEILDVFFKSHNPTTLNRQGNDVGTQYRSVIFYQDAKQKEIAERVIQKWKESGAYDRSIVTEVSPQEVFYVAENYHQNFYDNDPNAAYCEYVIPPKLEKLGLE